MGVIHLGPGDVAVGKCGDQLHTVLGSCVALILWAPQRHVAAMAHIALPGVEGAPAAVHDTRRADHAWRDMCDALKRRGVDPVSCICKVFGGARVFNHRHSNVGEKNIEAVRRLLAHHGVKVMAAHIGGTGYRELRLDVDTGDAWVRHRAGYVQVVQSEERYS